jgi:septum formation protein
MGKPGDAADARRMIRSLSGRWHRVYTGLALVRGPRHMTDYECTRVAFRRLTEPEITSYIASGEPSDKAGAYAIQGLGAALIRRVSGCYSNVIGLPIPKLLTMLADFRP